MYIPVHSPWLPSYINVTKTVPVILKIAGLFLDRPCINALFVTRTTGDNLDLQHDWIGKKFDGKNTNSDFRDNSGVESMD